MDNTNRGLDNSRYLRKPNSIIVLLYIQKLEQPRLPKKDPGYEVEARGEAKSHFLYAFQNMEFSRAF